MVDTRTLVDDVLLRELSAETRKIGSRVLIKATADVVEYSADITDVIILPHSDFYRVKFMVYYKIYNSNSVKALKELANNFPYTPDYNLGIAYVLNLQADAEDITGINNIKIRSEFEPLETPSASFLLNTSRISKI